MIQDLANLASLGESGGQPRTYVHSFNARVKALMGNDPTGLEAASALKRGLRELCDKNRSIYAFCMDIALALRSALHPFNSGLIFSIALPVAVPTNCSSWSVCGEFNTWTIVVPPPPIFTCNNHDFKVLS